MADDGPSPAARPAYGADRTGGPDRPEGPDGCTAPDGPGGCTAPDRPDGPDAARARLAAVLRAGGQALTPAVLSAFSSVPRHRFVPEVSPAAAYQDEALVIKLGADGIPVSSSSQPAMMAFMLEQLGLEPGHRVLEVGTGSGYNAAVMAHVVGAAGSVVTVDLDSELIRRARASLAAAGYGQVIVRRGDGGYGEPGHAPYDRIIVTAGAWDIAPAWLDQLAPGGRLVLPLSVRGIQLSVALERRAGQWMASSASRCSFVRMAGAFAGPEIITPLRASGLYVQVEDGRRLDTDALSAALAGPAADMPAEVRAARPGQLGDLDLWLALTEPGLHRIALRAAPGCPALLPFGGLVGGHGLAASLGVAGLVLAEPAARQPAGPGATGPAGPGAPQPAGPGPAGVVIRGYGPGGRSLAAHLAGQARRWDDIGRPGATDLVLVVCPAGGALPPGAGLAVLTRPNVRIAAGWPAS